MLSQISRVSFNICVLYTKHHEREQNLKNSIYTIMLYIPNIFGESIKDHINCKSLADRSKQKKLKS